MRDICLVHGTRWWAYAKEAREEIRHYWNVHCLFCVGFLSLFNFKVPLDFSIQILVIVWKLFWMLLLKTFPLTCFLPSNKRRFMKLKGATQLMSFQAISSLMVLTNSNLSIIKLVMLIKSMSTSRWASLHETATRGPNVRSYTRVHVSMFFSMLNPMLQHTTNRTEWLLCGVQNIHYFTAHDQCHL